VKDCRDALKNAFIKEGKMSPEEAENYLVNMQIQGRYNLDTW